MAEISPYVTIIPTLYSKVTDSFARIHTRGKTSARRLSKNQVTELPKVTCKLYVTLQKYAETITKAAAAEFTGCRLQMKFRWIKFQQRWNTNWNIKGWCIGMRGLTFWAKARRRAFALTLWTKARRRAFALTFWAKVICQRETTNNGE